MEKKYVIRVLIDNESKDEKFVYFEPYCGYELGDFQQSMKFDYPEQALNILSEITRGGTRMNNGEFHPPIFLYNACCLKRGKKLKGSVKCFISEIIIQDVPTYEFTFGAEIK